MATTAQPQAPTADTSTPAAGGVPAPVGAQGAPTSYKDPTYSQLDAATSAKLGLPSWLLPAIRTQGEKSNNDQVSAAGAQTVYQITPQTRQLAIDKYGIDPYLSASNASLVAGHLLSDSMQRNNGSVPQAVGEYIGGTDRSNWGPTTNSYIKRVLQNAAPSGASNNASVDTNNPYAAASASARQTATGIAGQIPNANGANAPTGPSIAKLVDAFNSGAMDQQSAQDFQNDVNNGRVLLPAGIKLTRTVLQPNTQPAQAQQTAAQPLSTGADGQPGQQAPQSSQQPAQPTPQAVPLKVVQAYQSGQMDPQAKADFEADMKAGKITLPQAQTPEQQGFLGQVGRQLGLFARDALQGVGNAVGVAYDPIAATINKATQAVASPSLSDAVTGSTPGTHIGTAGGYAKQLADTLGLPTPQTGLEKVVNAATEAGISGATMAGGAGALTDIGSAAPAVANAVRVSGTDAAQAAAQRAGSAISTQAPVSAGRTAAATLAANPGAQTVASAAGGGAQEKTAQAGGGAVMQTAANLGAALVAPSRAGNMLARGAEAVGQRIAPGLTAKISQIASDEQTPLRQAAEEVAQRIQQTPKDVAFDPQTGEITKEGQELSVASGLTPAALRTAYGKLQTAAEGNVQNAAVEQGKQVGIDYTQGQASGNFAQQDKEQTLVKAATPEGDQARAFFDAQQKQVNQAVDNFRASFGDPAATPAERGQNVQDSLRALRSQGQAGVRAMYKQAQDMTGEPVPLETDGIMGAAQKAVTEMPTEPHIKEAIQNTLAKYGLLGGDVTERGPFGNTVSAQGKSYSITGDVEPLTLDNAERMRQSLNAAFRADKTGHTGGVIAALDDAVETAVQKIAQRGDVQNPEVGQQMTHTAGDVSTSVTYVGEGPQPDTARVNVAPPAATGADAIAATNTKLAAERDQLAAQRAQTGGATTPAETALNAAGAGASAKQRAAALQWAQQNERPDVVQSVLNNARAEAEAARSASLPANPAQMAVQQKAAQQLEASAQKLHDAAGVPYGAVAEKEVPVSELSAGSRAGAERTAAFQQARAAARAQKQTYEAKDVIQDLTDYKTGTITPKVLPENTFTPLFNNPSNLRKAKAVLLSNDPEGTGAQAWKSVQAQALAHIADGAKNPQTGDYTAARLNSAIAKFGDENLRTLFDAQTYSKLKTLQAAIAKTQPLSGTVNYSNTFTKFANLIGAHISDAVMAAGAHVAGPAGAVAGKGLGIVAEKLTAQRKAGDALKSIVNPAAPDVVKTAAKLDKANKDLIDQLVNASKNNAFVPYGITNSNDSKGKQQ